MQPQAMKVAAPLSEIWIWSVQCYVPDNQETYDVAEHLPSAAGGVDECQEAD
jgi:hypothetical protein